MLTNTKININKERISCLLDSYAKFYWNGYDMWDEYNAFIINEKNGSLKFYNGPSFSNSYSKPQFASASSQLTGVSFNTQQITFKIGVYAVTEDQYRNLIYVLDPYEIGPLTFDFASDWYYMVKLSKIGDSTRYFIGKNSENEDLFYTELQLTFDIQGDAVAYSYNALDITSTTNDSNTQIEYRFGNDLNTDVKTPILLNFCFQPKFETTNFTFSIAHNDTSIELFNVYFKSLSSDKVYTLEYDSATGNLLLQNGNEKEILSMLTTASSGKRIITSCISKPFWLPSKWELPNFNNIKMQLKYNNVEMLKAVGEQNDDTYGITVYRRTNLI